MSSIIVAHSRRLDALGLGTSVEQCSAPPSQGGPTYRRVLDAARANDVSGQIRRKRALCEALARSAIQSRDGGDDATRTAVARQLQRYEPTALPAAFLYKRGTVDRPPPTPAAMERRDRAVWFALTAQRDVYGPIVTTYALRRPPKLVDIGRVEARALIARLAEQKYERAYVARLLNPDHQWSGAVANAETTLLMRTVLQPLGYDGTWIDDGADEPLLGAEECVLWRRFGQLLRKY
jgi:hypothetical protein